jgi:large subunit ribosomal protein L10
MPTPEKLATINELAEDLGRAKLTVLTDYRGLGVTALEGLRSTLRPMNAEFRVAKNTLTRIAAQQVGIQGLDPLLDGPLALVLAYEDIVGPAKAISDFARTSRILTVKSAVLENRVIGPQDVESLATMPSREELLGKLLGLMNSPMQRTVSVLSGPSRSVLYLLNGYAESQGEPTAAAAD